MSEQIQQIKVTIDDQTIMVDPGTSILSAARQIGGNVVPPALVHLKELRRVANKILT